MKIYRVKTQELYNELLEELEEQGYKWFTDEFPTENNYWYKYTNKTCIRLDETRKILICNSVWFYNTRYPDIEIIEYKGKNKPKQELNDVLVFPKDVYNVLKLYLESQAVSRFWFDYFEGDFSKTVKAYIEQNEAKISIALGTGKYECEKEPLYYVHFIKHDIGSYLNLKSDGTMVVSTSLSTDKYKTKFTEEEIKKINSDYWNETFLELVEDE